MMPEIAPTLGAALGLGFVLGLKHATEADHVVAVSTIVTQHRSVYKSALVGALWGIGHTLALLATGLALLILRSEVPPAVTAGLEYAVAVMIAALGASVLYRLLLEKNIHVHAHAHSGHRHVHLHAHHRGLEHQHDHRHGFPAWGVKSVAVGIVHGLAGSAALTLLVMQRLPGLGNGLLYIAAFGLGTVAGMILMSGLISLPVVLAPARYQRWHRGLCGGAGAGSIAFGIYYAYSVGAPGW